MAPTASAPNALSGVIAASLEPECQVPRPGSAARPRSRAVLGPHRSARRPSRAPPLLGDLSGVAEPDEAIRPDADARPGARRPVHVVLGKVMGGSLVGHPNHDERRLD